MSEKDQKRTGFGIGEAGSVPASTPMDEIEAERLQPRPRKYGVCQKCGQQVPKSWLMSSSRGVVCPDCYDDCSDDW